MAYLIHAEPHGEPHGEQLTTGASSLPMLSSNSASRSCENINVVVERQINGVLPLSSPALSLLLGSPAPSQPLGGPAPSPSHAPPPG